MIPFYAFGYLFCCSAHECDDQNKENVHLII